MREVWVTGMGLVSALGTGCSEHEKALRHGKSGLAPRNFFKGLPPDPVVCGLAPREVVSSEIDDNSVLRATSLLDRAAAGAMESAGFAVSAELEFVAGTTVGNMQPATAALRAIREGRELRKGDLDGFILHSSVIAVAAKLGIKRRPLTICSACGSGAAAIGHAFQRIRHGESSVALAGGFEALSPYVVAGFNSLRLVSKRSCRPFDRSRDGLSPGEGAAMLVLEDRESAVRRGARPLASVIGYGAGLDAYHYTRAHPEGRGLVQAATKALAMAGLEPGQVSHLHLHGTGTDANDPSEYAACKAVFGEELSGIPACSTKSLTGHAFGAASALTAAFSVLSLRGGFVPATVNCDDVGFEGLRVSNRTIENTRLSSIMTTALGFGGEAFALLLSQPSGPA